DPAAVDINIHPAKREVKFHREAEVRRWTAEAVRDALLKFHSRASKSFPPQPRPETAIEGKAMAVPDSRGSASPEARPPSQAPLPHVPDDLPADAAAPQPIPAHQPVLQMGFSQGRPLLRREASQRDQP